MEKTLLDAIEMVVDRKIKYLRHYECQVVNNVDPLKLGRIMVTIAGLGFSTPDKAVWANSRDKQALITPKNGDWVECYFQEGDKEKLVYIGKINEFSNQLPVNYSGLPTSHVIFESPLNQYPIVYDDLKNTLTIGNNFILQLNDLLGTLTLNNGTHAFVLGDNLMTFINTLVSTFNSHVHVDPQGGSVSPTATTLTAPSNLLSAKVMGV